MKKILPLSFKSLLAFIVLLSGMIGVVNPVSAQVPIPPTFPANGEIYPWGYQIKGTAWNTSQYLPFVYNTMPFRMLIPSGVTYNRTTNTFTNSTGEKFPVILFLHGSSVPGSDNGYQLSIGGKEFLDAFNAGKFRGIIIFPQNFTASWGSTQQTNILGIVNRLLAKGLADPFAISLTGTSSGGTGVWDLLANNPMVFSSCAPMSATSTLATSSIAKYIHVPLWLAQGAYDGIAKPSTANALVASIQNAGGNIKYAYYSDIGHGTWDKFLFEPDLFPFFSRANKVNPHVFFGRTDFCTGNTINIKLGVTAGFEAYEWRKDGTPISGATTNEITVTQVGTYDVRVRRSGQWSYWSPAPAVVRIKPPTVTPAIQLSGLSSTVLPDVNGNSTTKLSLPSGYTSYSWTKVGASQVIGTTREITATSPGDYLATVSEQYGCSSIPSTPFTIANANGENGPFPVIDLTGVVNSESEVELHWTERPSLLRNETGFEIWRTKTSGAAYELISVTPPNTTSFVNSGLSPNTTYFFKVRPINQNGAAAATDEFQIKTSVDPAPSAPANLRVTAKTKNSISLAWDASSDNTGISKYEIYTNGQKSLTTSGTAATVYSLIENQVYNFSIKARDLVGNQSPSSSQVTAVASATNSPPGAPPVPPVNLFAMLESDHVVLTWQDTSAVDLNGFQVWRATNVDSVYTPIGTASPSASAYTDQFISPGKTFYYALIALGKSGESVFSEIAYVTTDSLPTIPNAPSDLLATTLSSSAISITFVDNSDDENSFDLFRSAENNLAFIKIASLPSSDSGSVEYVDDNLFANGTYYYKVQAVNTGGVSDFSNESYAKTANTNPVLDSIPPHMMHWGTSLSLTLKASDVDAEYPTFSTDSLPSFATLTNLGNGIGSLVFNPIISDSGVYKIVIHTTDLNGGTDIDTLVLTVNDNNLPQITSPATQQLNEGESIVIPITATDVDSDPLTLQLTGLPSFAVFNATGNGAGTITIGPGFNHAGVYPITIEARDSVGGFSTKQFILTVNDIKSSYRLLINFSKKLLGTAPWNNTAASPTANLTKTGLVNTDNENSGISITMVTAWVNGSFTGEGEGGASPGIYPDNVMKSYYYSNDNNYKTVRLNGLNKNLKYNFTFFGSRAADGNNNTEYRIGTTTVTLNASRNVSNTVKISGVVPSATGEVSITIRRATGASYGYLNAMEVEAYPDNGQTPTTPDALTFGPITSTSVVLNWKDIAFNETGYEIYRSGNGTTFTRIATRNANTTTYTDNVSSKTIYFYKVLATNGYGASPYSNTISTTTPNAIPVISASATATVLEGATLPIAVSATDADDAAVTFGLLNNPSFVTIVPTGSKAGTLTIAPTSGSKGVYTVTITATDGSGGYSTRNIIITVNDVDIISTYINFNNGTNAALPWNNIAGSPSLNLSRTNLKDDKNVGTGINLTLLTAWQGAATTGTTTGSNSGIFPDDVMRTSYYEGGTTTKQIRFSGLSVTRLYNFIFFGSRSGTGDRTTLYTTGGQTVTLNTSGNTSQTVQINGVKPSAAGEIIVQVKKGTNANFADLNAMIIQSYLDSGIPGAPSELAVTTFAKNSLALQWKDNSSSETGFELWRSETNAPNDFTLVATTAVNATNFTNLNLQSDKVYHFKVRAIAGGTILSPFSNTLSVSTLAYTVSLNFNDFVGALAPWNNLNDGLSIDSPPFNFKDNLGNSTGISLSVLDNFNGTNTSGMNTGNNSGVYPDAVMRGFNYLETGASAKLLITGLNQQYGYHFNFFGSRQGTGDKTAQYTIGNKVVYLNASNNSTEVAQINNVTPQEDGTVLIDIYAPSTSGYAYINALVIQAFTLSPPAQGQTARTRTTTVATIQKVEPVMSETGRVKLVAFPNPFENKITLMFPDEINGEVAFELYEASGRKVKGSRVAMNNSAILEIDLSDTSLNPGLHLIKVANAEGKVEMIKVMRK